MVQLTGGCIIRMLKLKGPILCDLFVFMLMQKYVHFVIYKGYESHFVMKCIRFNFLFIYNGNFTIPSFLCLLV